MSSASQDNRASATASLMHAASEGDVQAMKALLAKGVDVNATNQGRQTALMLAALMGHPEIVTLLLAAGADASSRDRLGLTALEWSQRRGFPEVTKLLAGISAPIIQSTPKSTTSTDEKSKTESRTAIARDSHPKDLERASKSADKTFQTKQTVEAEAKILAERPAPAAAKSDVPETVTSSESPHVNEVAIAPPPASETAPDETEAPILEISPEPQPQQTAKAPDPTPKASEVSPERPHKREVAAEFRAPGSETASVGIEQPILEISSEPQPVAEAPARPATTAASPTLPQIPTPPERSHKREVAAEFRPPVSETASVETEKPTFEVSPERQSQPSVQQPIDVLPATSMALPQEPEPSEPEILSATTPKPLREPIQDEEETLTRATGLSITPDAGSPATGSTVAEPVVAESPRMRAARLAANSKRYTEPRQEEETLTRASDPGLTPDAPSPAAGSALVDSFASESPRMRAARLSAAPEATPSFQTSTLGISATPENTDSADVGELKRCPKCNTVFPNAQFSYCPHDYTKLITGAAPPPVPEASPASTPITVWLLIAFVLGSSAFAAYKLTAYLWRTEPAPTPVAAKPADAASEIKKPTFSVSGALAGLEVSVPEPEYPAELQSAGIGGPITVRIRVNKNGRVVSAISSSGDRRLRTAAVKAATQATFSPQKLAEVSQRGRVVSGSITYEFAATTTSGETPSNPTTTNSGTDSRSVPSNEPGTAAPANPNSPVVGDPLTNAALTVPAAEYPSRAKRAGIGGTITVTVRVNRAGKVISWRSSSGDSQLRAAALKAARKATFSREKLPGTGDVLGTITYNFTPE